MVLMIQYGSHRKEQLLMHIRLTVVHWKWITGLEVNTAWMLMPQTLNTNAKINVVYDIYEKDVLLDTVTSAIDLNGTQAWGEGKKIRYTLTLANKAAKVTFVPEVGPWSTADDTNVEK